VTWEPGKPSRNEDEYFAKRDAEWMRERRAQLDAERESREKTQPKLVCPRCSAQLQDREFQNIHLDVCPKCHGVWFDAGELEMVLHTPRGELLSVVNTVSE
jgi:uncharacterized protein